MRPRRMGMRKKIVTALLFTAVLATGFIAGHAGAAQPAMQAALRQLRAAENSLDHATTDKGGHRARALALTRDAIAEVERGIEYDRRH